MKKKAIVTKSQDFALRALCSMKMHVLMWKITSNIKIQMTGLCSLLLISR